jgi:3',5'-cyclic AMP phosphodiesterase CpdA
MLTLVVMADTHMFHAGLVVPDGDVLIDAGDLCRIGSLHELAAACDFIDTLPHRYKIIVAGNHDRAFQDQPAGARTLVEKFIIFKTSRVLSKVSNSTEAPGHQNLTVGPSIYRVARLWLRSGRSSLRTPMS